ncbi:hypothetical protein BGX34_010427 [Mortierella sp. NVP85]|nr:hypothetical protein BGX34_010427 [Mortierella sp. NVP85]
MDQLSLAGQFGLELQQSLEMAQRAERQSYAQLQALQDENIALQARVHRSHVSDHHGTEDDTNDLTAENENLQRELDVCRRELKTFRKELDNLVEQMAEMGTEVVDAKNKVSVYSRRLNEVEQELNSTQELNVNLQEQLRNSLERQKQANTSTTQAMKQMQTELGRVVSDSGALRSNLVELESRQEKCEGKVVEMISNTKEYANLLEEAQTTIQTLRTESDMEGRWGHHPTMGSGWNKPRKQNSEPLSTLAMEDPELNHPDFPAEELDPHAWTDEPEIMPGMSLGTELGLGMTFNTVETEVQVEEDEEPSPPLTPASYQSPKQPTPELSPQLPIVVQHKETQTLAPPPPQPQPQQQQQQQSPPPPQQLQRQQSTSPAPKNVRKFSAHSFPSEFQQRLDDITTQQTAITGMTRPPWNPSVALEPEIANPSRFRSRSVSRGPSISSQSSSRSVSQASQYLGTSAPVVSSMKKSRTLNSMPSLQASPPMAAPSSSSSLQETAAPGQMGRRSRSTASVTNNNSAASANSKNNRPRSRTAAATVEKSPVVAQQSSSTARLSISSSSSATKGSRNVSVSAAADKSAPKVKVITGGIKTQSPAALSPNESSSTEVKTVTSPSTASEVTTGRTTPRSPRPASLSPVPGANPSGSMGSPALSPVPQNPSVSNQ